MQAKLSVTFVLPRAGHYPSGGLRVIYEYANRLSLRGHRVALVHPARARIDAALLERSKTFLRFVQRTADKSYRPESWFHLEPEIKVSYVPSLASRWIPDADIIVATAWQTAEWVTTYSTVKGKRFYLIQHFEKWSGPEGRVIATWKEPLTKIVVSKWLCNLAKDFGENAAYIPNGLDTERLRVTIPPEERDRHRVMMLYHVADWKGSSDALEALSLVHRSAPALRVTMFGVPPIPRGLPPWIEYHRTPAQEDLRRLYNEAAIFIAPSWTEGWGLPACEALLCGSAIVATDIDGHREFAFDERTALVCASKSPTELADRTLRLIRDPALRIKLAQQGNEYVRQFTWERATSTLESVLLGENQSEC